ncbi:major facilitator superfamily domain-containing protein [Mycena haematopus]|nr:major facilitator superfamily domain-containing protein [Mycena haematopus]
MFLSFDRSLLYFSIAANALCAGSIFMFPLLSPVLAEHVKLTQPQLTTIVLAGMAGQYPWTPLVGKLIDSRGPWLCSLIASLLFPLAFACFSSEVNRMLEAPSEPPQTVYLLVFLFGLAGFATVFSYLSTLFAAIKNFPDYPGIASGTVTTLFGLSPLVLSFVASTFFMDGVDKSLDVVKFLNFLAILTGVVHIIGALNLRVPANNHPAMMQSQNEAANEATALLHSDGRNQPNGSSLDLVRDPYFWIFFMVLAVMLGPCEMIISNIGSIVLSLPSASTTVLSESSGAAALQVKTLAICNTVTRLLTGPIADFVSPVVASELSPSPRKHYTSRVIFLLGPALVLAFTFLWMALFVQSQADVWVLSVGTGIAYGGTFTILPSIISSVWGMRHTGRNFGIVVYAPLTGTVMFSYLYAFISEYHTPSGGFCRGCPCWQATFWICAGLQVVAAFYSLILWRSWKGLL